MFVRRFATTCASATLLIAPISCSPRSTPAPKPEPRLEVKPLAEARLDCLATSTIGSIERSLDEAATIANSLMVPMDVAAIRAEAFHTLGLPPEVSEAIDTSKPMGVALVSAGSDKPPEPVLAITTRSVADTAKIMRSLGKEIGRRRDAVGFQQPDAQTAWLWPEGTTVVAARDAESLIAGASVARDAMHAQNEDISATIYPATIARWKGTDVKSAVHQFTQEFLRLQQHAGPSGEAFRHPVYEQLTNVVAQWVTDAAADVEEVQVRLRLDKSAGGTVSFEFRPRPNTPLAMGLRSLPPFHLEPALLAGSEPSAVLAGGPNPLNLQLGTALRSALIPAEAKDAELLGKAWDAWVNAWTGAMSLVMRGAGRGLAYEAVAELKPEASPSELLDFLATFHKSPAMRQLFSKSYGPGTRYESRRNKDVLVNTLTLDPRQTKSEMLGAFRAAFGDNKMTTAFAFAPGRMLFGFGGDAAARVEALTHGQPGVPGGELAAALTESQGANGFAFMDVAALAVTALRMTGGNDVAVQTMSSVKIPCFATIRGGDRATVDFRVPMTAVRGIWTLMRMAN